ncbi:MAG: hypothetical protein Q8S92_02385 [Hydrogenophaga sp.]|uniref:hypothetical protein n=1 Tax=Hydrogenophaga sp. TaxID=1904254 RepID=UPI00271B9E0B|nr:hypothetical protein [Hydrogenophaga sp.]MDO9507017.1 hypothetical protein [Hydrogenophaga sp.]MDP3347826.1 hypothetical protein [Hydrogenophaga sp.]
MFGLTQETFFALIVGTVFIAQFLFKQLRRKAEEMQPETQPEADAQSAPTPVPLLTNRSETPAIAVDAYKVVEELRTIPSPVVSTVSRVAGPRRRRFSRQALMPDRRAVQDAVVVSTILKPCHAHKPHGTE